MSMLLLLCMMESAMTIYEKKNYLKMMEKKNERSRYFFIHVNAMEKKIYPFCIEESCLC